MLSLTKCVLLLSPFHLNKIAYTLSSSNPLYISGHLPSHSKNFASNLVHSSVFSVLPGWKGFVYVVVAMLKFGLQQLLSEKSHLMLSEMSKLAILPDYSTLSIWKTYYFDCTQSDAELFLNFVNNFSPQYKTLYFCCAMCILWMMTDTCD